jgi:lysophospholipase L1-like esterase
VLQQGVGRVVARAASAAPVSVSALFPRGTGDIEIVSHGAVTWSDLRVERGANLEPLLALLSLLCVSLLSWERWFAPAYGGPIGGPGSRGRQVWKSPFIVGTSVLISLVLVEAMLRAVGSRLVPGTSALRHDLGEPTEDPRWQQTSRYGQRLRANADVPGEWRYGDIIRLGFVPQAEGDGRLHRYPFHADSEGFRNAAPRDPIDVAALGDSFTDALTMRREDAWPARLEARLGRPVQNYGTAGFGPQQELLVLKDFALPHHPRVVVLAFFAGNDIRDAEAFESFVRSEASTTEPRPGWPIKQIVMRADTWFLTSVLQAATQALTGANMPEAATLGAPRAAPPPAHGDPSFSRGMFTADVNGKTRRWALMPPYLNLLNFDEHDLSARRGWALIESSLVEMRQVSRAAGAEFVVAFIPFKSQVYLPLLERLFGRAALEDALHFYTPDSGTVPDIDRMLRNRLAQNALMARFCERAGIPLIDLTSALQARVEAGETMYFPDDSHLDESGEALVAEHLAAFLSAYFPRPAPM